MTDSDQRDLPDADGDEQPPADERTAQGTALDPAALAGTAPASPVVDPTHDPKMLRQALLETRQALRKREAELELSQQMGRDTLSKLKDQHERTLRAIADLENHKKRVVREREDAAKFGLEKVLKDFLPVVDNFDRALEHAKGPADFESLKAGLLMTRKLFEDTLARYGVKGFSAMGQPFDPNFHEAIQTMESDQPAGTVTMEVVRGYTLHDRLMRPAMVAVSKGPAPAPGASGGSTEPSSGSESTEGA